MRKAQYRVEYAKRVQKNLDISKEVFNNPHREVDNQLNVCCSDIVRWRQEDMISTNTVRCSSPMIERNIVGVVEAYTRWRT